MTFNSLNYIFVFLPITVVGYYVLRGTRFSNFFMLVASLFFYAASALWYLPPMFFSALVDYFVGQRIADSSDPAYRKRMLVLSIIVNLGLLSIFKYTGWLSTEVSALLAVFGVSLGTVSLPLPAGISFYTFQSMSYAIDIYRKEFKPHRNVVDYMSFVSFFPHLVAGPIMRARDLLPQLAATRKIPSCAEISGALFLILFGLFQKTVVADNVGAIVETVSKMMGPHNQSLPPGVGFLFMYGFALQIYCDFSAYCTIARGSAKLFNVNLVHNFLTPYFATSPSDFWHRWHISLSTWLRDYLYIPLGGNRHGNLMTMRNLMLTMLLGGLWHGAGFFFILWGVYHGLLLIIYRAVPIDKYLVRLLGAKIGKLAAIFLFFHLVCIGWIFFRSTPGHFLPIWSSMLELPGAILHHLQNYQQYFAGKVYFSADYWQVCYGTLTGWLTGNWYLTVFGWGLILCVIPIFVTDLIAWRRGTEFPDLFPSFPLWAQVSVILFLLYAIQFFGRRESNEFIYFAF